MLYKDFYDQLDGVSLEGVRTLRVSNEHRFAHVFMLDPDHIEHRDALVRALVGMRDHPLGGPILDDLGIGNFAPYESTGPIRELLAS